MNVLLVVALPLGGLGVWGLARLLQDELAAWRARAAQRRLEEQQVYRFDDYPTLT